MPPFAPRALPKAGAHIDLVACVLGVVVLGVAFLPAVVAQGTPASFANESWTFEGNLQTLHLVATAPVVGRDATALRGGIDQLGDRDGTVTQAEVDRALAYSVTSLVSALATNVTLEGAIATNLTVNAFRLDGAPGAASSNATIVSVVDVTYLFAPTTAKTPTLLLKGSRRADTAPRELLVTVTSPAGRQVGTRTGGPEGNLSADGRVWTYIGSTGHSGDVAVAFPAVAGPVATSKGSPSAALPVLVLAALGATALGRKRR